MKKLFLSFLLVLAFVCLHASDLPWNDGVLLSYDQETFMVNTVNHGTGGDTPNTTYRIRIDAGDRIYFAERTLRWRWQKFPRVTENAPIKWRPKGNREMEIEDDVGKPFVLTITKTKLKTHEPAAAGF